MAASCNAIGVYSPTMLTPDDPSSELQALLDAAVDAVILIDARGHIEVFNRSAERLFGYAAAEVIGLNVSVLMIGKDQQRHDAYICLLYTSRCV